MQIPFTRIGTSQQVGIVHQVAFSPSPGILQTEPCECWLPSRTEATRKQWTSRPSGQVNPADIVLNGIPHVSRHTSRHRGRWSLSRYSPRRSARIHAAPAIAKVSVFSLQFA